MKIDGKQLAEKISVDLHKRIDALKKKNIIPHLVVLLIGENPASVAYVAGKQKKGESLNAKVTVLRYTKDITTEELAKKITLLNEDPYVHGILIQRPVPDHIDIKKLELLTDPKKDIDGFHPDSPFVLPLPLAVIKILGEIHNQTFSQRRESPSNKNKFSSPLKGEGEGETFLHWLKNKSILIIGKGDTGGKPVMEHLKKLEVNFHPVDSKTKNPEELMKQADIIISCVGKPNVIKPEMLKKSLPAARLPAGQGRQGVILISVGLFRGEDGKLHGDYEEEAIKNIASYYTPTPGGVGPVNVAMLWDNLVTATERTI